MYEMKAVVREKAGIHCRPSSVIVLAAQEYRDHRIELEANGGSCVLTGILDLLTLNLQHGSEVTIKVTGLRERECCEKMAELLEREYGFRG